MNMELEIHMHHLEGNASPAGRLFTAQWHQILWSSVPSAVPKVTLTRESCRPSGRKRLFLYKFWGPYIRGGQTWSALGHPLSPSLRQISLKSVKRLTHTRRKTSKSRIRFLWKRVFKFVTFPTVHRGPRQKTFTWVHNYIPSALSLIHIWRCRRRG